MMNIRIQQTPIQGLNELSTTQLDQAISVKLKIAENNADIPDFKGVYNLTQDRMANIVTSNYQIIQHRDVLESIYQTLNRLNLTARGKIIQYKDSMDMRIAFTDKNEMLIKDDQNGIRLGMRILNSYNKTTSFRMELYGIRLFCNNGMILGKALKNVRSITKHLGTEKDKAEISRIVEVFVGEMINSSTKLQEYVNKSMKDSIEWELAKKIIEKLVVTEKHNKKLVEELERTRISREGELTRWDLYNALTSYITHNEQLSPHIETRLSNIAQDILVTHTNQLKLILED